MKRKGRFVTGYLFCFYLLLIFLGIAYTRMIESIPPKRPAKHKGLCGYTIIVAETGVDCKGDTIKVK